eukprot:jgi/Astpho2/8864/fgenesh1_pg.00129_%23_44_t
MLTRLAKVGRVIAGQPSDGATIDKEVDRLLQRIADGLLPDDRREGLAALRDLLTDVPQAQAALGSQGLPVLCDIVKNEQKDIDMLQLALECLVLALSQPVQDSPSQHKQAAQPGAVNADLFARQDGSIATLLVLLEDAPRGIPDFYVRYHTMQLLTLLAVADPGRMQEAVLAAPMGIIRLMDMLGEREVIRNEALILLSGLVRGNTALQQIAAFEGAFERLLGIVREEGGCNGDIVVQDSLELLNSLLWGNAGNCKLFREMGLTARLPELLDHGGDGKLSRQKAGNLMAALGTVKILLSLADGDQQVMLQTLLYTQDQLELWAAQQLLHTFCSANQPGCTKLLGTVQPADTRPGPGGPAVRTFGSMLLTALLATGGHSLQVAARACSVLTYLMADSQQCREQLLQGPGSVMQHSAALLVSALNQAGQAEAQTAAGVCLAFLLRWLDGSAAVAQAFLDKNDALNALVGCLTTRDGVHPVISGLAAAVLGQCFLSSQQQQAGQAGQAAAAAVLDTLNTSVGLLSFFEALGALRSAVQQAQQKQGKAGALRDSSADPQDLAAALLQAQQLSAAQLEALEQTLRGRILDQLAGPYPADAAPAAVQGSTEQERLASADEVIRRLQGELERLRAKNRQLVEASLQSSRPVPSGASAPAAAQQPVAQEQQAPSVPSSPGPSFAAAQARAAAEARADSAEAKAARLQQEVQSLQGRVATLQNESSEAQQAAAQVQAAASKHEADLQDLSGAYTGLEAHCYQVEAEVRRLKEQLAEASAQVSAQAAADQPASQAHPQKPGSDAEAEGDADAGDTGALDDLLICLGQEEEKVQRLSEKLEALGVHVQPLLEGIGDEEEIADLT